MNIYKWKTRERLALAFGMCLILWMRKKYVPPYHFAFRKILKHRAYTSNEYWDVFSGKEKA